jgi:rhodanese-related sulfurtransferase
MNTERILAVAPARTAAVAAATPRLAARHFLDRLAFETDPSDLAADLDAGVPGLVVVDVRDPEAYAAGHIPGAINLPYRTIDQRSTAGLERHALLITYCWGPACNASTKGALALSALGFAVKELLGGLSAWEAEGFAVEGGRVRSLAPAGERQACAC